MGLVLDTSALIAMERLLLQGISPDLPWSEIPVLPAIVWAEALIGARLADSPQRAAQRRAYLESVRRVAAIEVFGPEIAECYADIYAELRAAGTMIPQNDLAVAATGRKLGASVLVGPSDGHHFRRVDGLDVIVLLT